MNKDLGQQIVHQKVQKGHINYVAHLIEDAEFIFHLINKTKTHRKVTLSINFIAQHFVHFVVQFRAVL